MRKLIALGAMVLLMVLALAAESTPVGSDDTEGRAFPGKRVIGAQGQASTFGGILQAPAIATSADSIAAAGADATLMQEP